MLGYLSAVIVCYVKRKENCGLRGTDNACGKIYEYIFWLKQKVPVVFIVL